MRLNLRQIEAFRAAMEFGSATAAAEFLHVTQPAVSRLVSDLETAVGFQLFERRARGLVPTQDAKTLYVEVKKSFVGLERIGQVADAVRDKTSGTVRVIALTKYADRTIARIIGRFLRDNPGIVVELESGGTGAVVQGITSQTFDIGIAAATVPDPMIHAEPLFETRVVMAVQSSDPLAAREIIPVHALDGRRLVALPRNSQFGAMIERALRREKVTPIVVGRARTHSALCRMVGSGAGVALIDEAIASHYTTPEVVFREIDPPIRRTVSTLVNLRIAPSIAANALLETLRSDAKRIADLRPDRPAPE